MMIRENAKMIAGAVAALVVLLLKPYVPAVLDPSFQPALEVVIGAVIVAATVWFVPNKTKGNSDEKENT